MDQAEQGCVTKLTRPFWRWGVIVLSVALLLPILLKSRTVPPREQAAFLRYTTGSVLVKITGTGKQDGIYRFPDGNILADVNKLTGGRGGVKSPVVGDKNRRLSNGDAIVYGEIGGYLAVIAVEKMPAAESVLLGIPLDPDSMSVTDWEALPGIGPSLAKAIVLDRQNNGNFHDLEGVSRVPGIGPGKIRTVQRFFATRN
jgi:competence protein ComEA